MGKRARKESINAGKPIDSVNCNRLEHYSTIYQANNHSLQTHNYYKTTHTSIHTAQRACFYSEGETTSHDMKNPPTYQPPHTKCHTYRTIILALPVTESAKPHLISFLIALRPLHSIKSCVVGQGRSCKSINACTRPAITDKDQLRKDLQDIYWNPSYTFVAY